MEKKCDIREVKVFKVINHYPSYKIEEEGKGLFIQYGQNYEEFESGPGNYTSAIVEMPDGTVRNLPIHLITFV